METLKISSKSNVNAVAGAIAGLIKDNKSVEMKAVGAGAVNQAIKSVIIANGFIAPTGQKIKIEPAFCTVEIEDEDRSAIKLKLVVEE